MTPPPGERPVRSGEPRTFGLYRAASRTLTPGGPRAVADKRLAEAASSLPATNLEIRALTRHHPAAMLVAPMNREFLIDLRGNDAHILLAGEVDTLATAAVARAMDRAVRMPVRSIVMNLDNVTFIDSAGLGALAAGYHEAARCGLGYRIGPGAVPIVARILSVTRLGELTHEPTLGDETQASG